MTDEIVDATFTDLDGHEEYAVPETAARQPGATFRSVFGTSIVNAARSSVATSARGGWSERDREAAFPAALAASILDHANKPEAAGLIGNPGTAQATEDLREAMGFAQAYERQTGVRLVRKRVSAHEEMRMTEEAEEFVDTGFCEYIESAHATEMEYRYAERNRQDAQRVRVVRRVRERGMCR